MNLGRIFLAVLLPASVCACVREPQLQSGPSYLQPGRYEQTVDVHGVSRQFILRVPTSVDVSKPTALVIVLHGWTASAHAAEVYTKMAEQATKSGFIVAFPDGLGTNQGWNAGFIDLSGKKGDDIGFISNLIDKVAGECDVYKDRVFVAGHSNGAFMANDLGATLGNKIAAIGVVAGTVGIPSGSGTGYKTIPDPVAPISVIAIHGRKDVMVAYDATTPALLKDVSAPDSAKWWAEKDGCSATPVTDTSADGTVVTTTYTGGKNGTEVRLVTLKNGTHDWPGGYGLRGPETASGFDAAQALWDFFRTHPRVKG